MIIEVKTTTVKLTKQKVLQMFQLPEAKMSNAKAIGYLNLNNKEGKTALIESNGEYFVLNTKWELRGVFEGSTKPYWGYTTPKGERIKRFDTIENATNLFKQYKGLVNESNDKGHIFL